MRSIYAGKLNVCMQHAGIPVCWKAECMYAACWHAFRIFFDACMPHARIAKRGGKCLLKAYFFGCLYAALGVACMRHAGIHIETGSSMHVNIIAPLTL